MESATQLQIPDEVVCISLCADALGKGTNPSAIPSPMGKLLVKLDSLAMVNKQSRRRKTEFKPVVLPLKFDLVLQPAQAKGLNKYILAV